MLRNKWRIASHALLLSLALGVTACGRDGDNTVSARLGQQPGSDAGMLTGDEVLARPLELPDRTERVLPITNAGLERAPFLAQVADNSTCIGFYLDGSKTTLCKPPAEWDTFASVYATTTDGKRSYVIGAVRADIDEVTITFPDDVVVIPTVATADTDLVRFFAAPVPAVNNVRIVGSSGGQPILRIDYPETDIREPAPAPR